MPNGRGSLIAVSLITVRHVPVNSGVAVRFFTGLGGQPGLAFHRGFRGNER